MGNNVTIDAYSAILVPDEVFGSAYLSAADSTYVEKDPTTAPIEPDAGVETSVLWQAAGEPDAGTPLYLRVQSGGNPDGMRGMSFAWKSASGDPWIGWDSFGLWTGYEVIDWSTSTTLGFQNPDIEKLANGDLICCYDEPVSTTRRRVKVRRWDEATATWQAAVTVWTEDTGNTSTRSAFPRMVVLPSGKILLFHWVWTTTIGQLWCWYSDDNGANWSRSRRNCLLTPFSLTPNPEFRGWDIAYGAGQLLAIVAADASSGNDEVLQFASIDQGHTFSWISTQDASPVTIGSPSVVYAAGYFVVAVASSFTIVNPIVTRTASARDPLPAFTEITGSGDHVALAADEDGNVFLYFSGKDDNTTGVTQDVAVQYSSDAGDSWAYLIRNSGMGVGAWYKSTRRQPGPIAAVLHRGRFVMVGNLCDVTVVTPPFPGTIYRALCAWTLGGYTDVPVAEHLVTATTSEDEPPRQQQAPDVTWFGADSYANHTGVTNNSTGAPTRTIVDGYENVVTGAGDTDLLDVTTAAGTTYAHLAAEVVVNPTSGTGRTRHRSADGTNICEVEVEVSTTQITLRDLAGAGTVSTARLAGRCAYKVEIRGRNASLWHRTWGMGPVRDWTLVGSLTNLVETVAATTNRTRRHTAPSSEVRWYELRFYHEDQANFIEDRSTGTPGEGFLFGRPASTAAATLVADDVGVRCLAGPGFAGQTFTMTPEHERPIEHLFPREHASPRRLTRLNHAVNTDIAWSSGFTTHHHFGSDTIGIYLRMPVEGAEFWGRNLIGVWVKIATLTTARSLAYTRTGDAIYPAVSGSSGNSYYYERGEGLGGYFVFDSVPEVARTVEWNTEGNWDAGAVNEKRPTFFLKGIDGTEPASGTGVLVFPESFHAINMLGVRYKDYRLRLHPSAVKAYVAPPNGYFQGSVFAAGGLTCFGWQPARDHAVQRESLAEVDELPDGTKIARAKITSGRRTVRRVEFSVSDGVDVTKTRGLKDPDYVKATSTAGGEPIANRNDLPLLLSGLVEETDGPVVPIVYVPRIPVGPPDVVSLLGRTNGVVYGRLTSAARLENIVGKQALGEVFRGPRYVLEEEP